MIKKFLIYFSVFFLISFSILNSRYVSAQIDFWFHKNQIAKDAEVIIADELKAAKATPIPLATATPSTDLEQAHTSPSTSSGPSATPTPILKGYVLEMPTIGVTTPIIMEPSTDTKIILKDLNRGVVHYADTPMPGERGTSIILGHSSAYPWYGGNYGSVFSLLSKLKDGDYIFVKKEGKVLTYKVNGSIIFHPLSKNESINKFGQTNDSSIVLVSCWPLGTDQKRIAVKADLVN